MAIRLNLFPRLGPRLAQMKSSPFRERLEGFDTNPYAQPAPVRQNEVYQTFWMGNQVPAHYQSTAFTGWIPVKSQDFTGWQRRGGTFDGAQLGQAQTAQLLARMHALWTMKR